MPAGTVLVPPRLDLTDLPLPRAVVFGPQVRWSFTGRDELPCGGADADGRVPVPVRRVAAAGARRLPALELLRKHENHECTHTETLACIE
jgi:hypothetical protein